MEKQQNQDESPLENRPGIFIIGSSNVGKRTLLSRLLSLDFEDSSDSATEVLVHGWTINTKYYTADVSLWTAHLHEGFSISTLPIYNQLTALVMVFDMSDLSTLIALQDWVSQTNLEKFEILLCIANKVDLIPDHPVHAEYRRSLLKLEDSYADLYPGSTEYGISETEGSTLLGEEEPSWEIRRSCLEWCSEHSIEFVEACASNADFDKCLSVNGDSQGVERLFGALSAHMWPGMVLKSGNKIADPILHDKQELSEEESEYEFEYEILSAGSAEPWDDTDEGWVSASGSVAPVDAKELVVQSNPVTESNLDTRSNEEEIKPATSDAALQAEIDKGSAPIEEPEKVTLQDEAVPFDFENLEQLMSEIGIVRDNLRLMPDFQRRERAANLALKMAAMFGGESDDEGY